MEYLVGIVIIVVGLLLSIGLHELGHLVPAKKFGVRVPQYMIGFGPTVFSFTRGETEYGVKAIPLGGYVRLVGMYAPGSAKSQKRSGKLAEFIQSARDASTEEILPGEEHRAFYNLSTPKKIVVMFGGPFVNLVIAFGLFMGIMMLFGQMQPTTTLGSVSQCVLDAQAPADAQCDDSSIPAPAHEAGLLPGDEIVAWGDTPVSDWEQLTELIGASAGQTVQVSFVRDGATQMTLATPVVAERPLYDESGSLVTDSSGQMVLEERGFMGMGSLSQRSPVPFVEAVDVFGEQLAATGKVILSLPQRLVDVAQAAFGGGERDPNSVVGIVGIGRFAGELTASDEINGFVENAVSMINLVAGLNLALFAFNMIPLPPLDGGHIASALFEGGRRRAARLRGAPDPGPADTARLLPLSYAMFLLFAGMGLLLIYADLVNPIKLFG